MSTSMGEISLAIDTTNTPITGENFKQYVDSGFYDGLIFHRVVHQFVVQGGGFTPDLVQKETRGPIQNEASVGISNLRGTLAMARSSAANSATSQFYINTVDNVNLDQEHASDGVGYAVFGKVITGMNIVDQIDIVDTNNSIPVENILINSISEMACPAT
ncbi:peptidyl-prolyl cis-trans isomerase, cyclophilin family [Shewanella violacea DSS12]|uniref:Peptidyl-prolyl cis-trans isomerase n=2 Tax=Shewanella violacea TaxID=60217 RepID=D4ZGB9_SHEVD|nr:peptidyl-prolyl cis-trans isomerase, cyclophilin family [Shewanella violacea DSS12]